MFTRKKWDHAVDINHGLNLVGIEVIHEMEGNKNGCMGIVWSSGTIKDVHRAVERKMMSNVSFKLIGEAHQDVWVDGVELDVKKFLIYIITHYGLEAKARATGCEISITVNGAKLDDYCCHIICGFTLTGKDLKDPYLVASCSTQCNPTGIVFILYISSLRTTKPHTIGS
jgi:hypothetical protein